MGDDRRNDIWGARDAGCDAWLWGSDVHSFKEVLISSLLLLAIELHELHVFGPCNSCFLFFFQLLTVSDCIYLLFIKILFQHK